MRTPPPELSDDLIGDLLREGWGLSADGAEHVPWGFGAWHWVVSDAGGERRWFATADRLPAPDRLIELEQAYAAARELSRELPVVACLPTVDGDLCRQAGGFAVSVTPWIQGERPGPDDLGAAGTARFLAALHTTSVPSTLPVWDPQYASHRVLDDLAAVVGEAWGSGPFAEEARDLVGEHLRHVEVWRQRYTELAEHALTRRDEWVVTHGEPGAHNQIRTPDGARWVDWESVRLAPRERDLEGLFARDHEGWRGAYPHPIDPDLLELFDLAWRLDEVGQYTDWFRQPHAGTEDDRIALDGLREELERTDRRICSRD